MNNSEINYVLKELNNAFEKFKDVVEEEVSKMETSLNKEQIRDFKRLLINNLNISRSTDNYGNIVIKVSGFESSAECSSHTIKGFKLEDRYSRNKIYVVKGKEHEELKIELKEVKESFENFIVNLYEKEKHVCEENSSIAKMNQSIYDGLMEHIVALGFNKSHLAYKTKRSKRPERMNHVFVDDLKNQVKTYYLNGSAEVYKNKLIKKLDDLISEVLNIKLEERRKEIEENKRKYKELKDNGILNELVNLENYIKDLNLDGLKRLKKDNGVLDLQSIKEKLFNLDKFIEIGYLLELNRNKLINGVIYANKAKSYIKSKLDYSSYTLTKENKDWLEKAYEDLDDTINSFVDDGRIFRDMTYNYNEFYNKAGEINNIPFNKLNKVVSKILEIELKLDII